MSMSACMWDQEHDLSCIHGGMTLGRRNAATCQLNGLIDPSMLGHCQIGSEEHMLLIMGHAGCGMGESCLVGRGRAGRLLQPPGCPASSAYLALHIQADQLPGRPAGCALCSGAVLLQRRASIISTCFASCPFQQQMLRMALSRLRLHHAVT